MDFGWALESFVDRMQRLKMKTKTSSTFSSVQEKQQIYLVEQQKE